MVIQMCYAGPRERGVEYLQAISSWDGERCLLNEVNEKSFLNQQDSVAQVLRGKGAFFAFTRLERSASSHSTHIDFHLLDTQPDGSGSSALP